MTQIFIQITKNLYIFFQANSVKSLDGSGASSMFGSIDTKCEIAPIIESAYEAARDLCEYHYMTAPELDFRPVNAVPGDDSPPEKLSFVYVPAHLYHIMFELIKNSMRATIERHGDHTVYLPPIKSKLICLFTFNSPIIRCCLLTKICLLFLL